jgi:peptidoglycan/LPS O-acetylase OafA/YrhL
MNETPASSTNPSAPQKLAELEGLRGWLAWWVVFGHFFIESGWNAEWLPTLCKLILSHPQAVKLFIILSGFVITLLLDKSKANYREFITTRAFRIFPLYYTMLVIGACILRWTSSFYPEYLSLIGNPSGLLDLYSTWSSHLAHMPEYLAACIFGLHGAIPNSLLPHAQGAFVSQAWSISLEWQFYLVAPLLWWALKSRRGLLALSAAFYIVMGTRHHFTIGDWSSFLPQSIEFFAVGSISYFAYKHVRFSSEPSGIYARVLLSAIILAVGFAPFFSAVVFIQWPWFPLTGVGLALAIWLVVLTLIIARKHTPTHPFVRCVSYPLTNKVMLYLGRISYSTYLSHYLVIIVLQWAMLRFAPQYIDKRSMLLVFCTVGIVLTVMLSALCHRLIELPGIALGKRFVRAKPVQPARV